MSAANICSCTGDYLKNLQGLPQLVGIIAAWHVACLVFHTWRPSRLETCWAAGTVQATGSTNSNGLLASLENSAFHMLSAEYPLMPSAYLGSGVQRCCHVCTQVNYATGDSFIRMLLNILPLQQHVATMLLDKLPEYSQADCEDGAPDSDSTSSTPNLILGQLRW
jgi:hypothetical protein